MHEKLHTSPVEFADKLPSQESEPIQPDRHAKNLGERATKFIEVTKLISETEPSHEASFPAEKDGFETLDTTSQDFPLAYLEKTLENKLKQSDLELAA